MSVKDCSRPPGSDIWAHFAGFLAELIARHAEELDIDSWRIPRRLSCSRNYGICITGL